MPPAQTALQTSIGEDVGLGNHARQPHRIFQGKCVQGSTKTNTLRALRRRSKHRQRIGRNRELLKEMVIDDRVHVKPKLTAVFDLWHGPPDPAVLRLSGRSWH